MSRRGKPPSPPQPETPEATPETPAQAERRKRGLLGWLLIALIALAVLAVVLVGAGRLAVLTPAGRELVLSFIEGKEIGRYGRINVEGLSGDLWDDFTLDRVTITDRDGVWLEAETVLVDWSYLPLITRRFHADSIRKASPKSMAAGPSKETCGWTGAVAKKPPSTPSASRVPATICVFASTPA